MNGNEYIESGILEAYALGELPADERAHVEAMLAQHPALRDELADIEMTMEMVARDHALKPSATIKGKLMASVATPVAQSPKVENNRVPFWRYSLAASLVLFVGTAVVAFLFYGRWQKAENQLAELLVQNQRLAGDFNSVNQRLDKMEGDVKVVSNPAFERTVLNATPSAPGAQAYVFWNRQTRELYLGIQQLRALSAESQYQLWAIVDGKPVDAGVFDPETGLLRMKDMAGATAFAVTIEPRGGKASPTLETMQVIGEVGKS